MAMPMLVLGLVAWFGAQEVAAYTDAECISMGYNCACGWTPGPYSSVCNCGYARISRSTTSMCCYVCTDGACAKMGGGKDVTNCAVHPGCDWTGWSWAGGCSTSCGSGSRTRTRTCAEGNGATQSDSEACTAGQHLAWLTGTRMGRREMGDVQMMGRPCCCRMRPSPLTSDLTD